MKAATATPRILQLDVLRGIALLLVLGRHLPPPGTKLSGVLLDVTELWRRCGWVGVDLFFVLSGFLVSGLLFREYQKRRDLDIKRFLFRRAFKIYPGFYVLLACTLLFFTPSLLRGDKTPDRSFVTNTIGEALFVQNYYDSWWSHTWSLAVEEHFYLAVALLLWKMSKATRPATPAPDDAPAEAPPEDAPPPDPFRNLPNLFFAVATFCLILRFRNALDHEYRHATHMFYTHLRADSLFFGVLLAYLRHFHAEKLRRLVTRYRWALLVAGLALVAPSTFLELHQSFFMHTAGLTCLYLGFGALLLLTLDARRFPSGPVARALGFIGFHSYSIYLWHMAVRTLAWESLPNWSGGPLPYPASAGIYLAGSLALGIVAAKLVEVPTLKLRDRWFPSRDQARPPTRAAANADKEVPTMELVGAP